MECFFQKPGSSSAHIDVGQTCCFLDDVFMITLIKTLEKETLRYTLQLVKTVAKDIMRQCNPRNKFVHRLVVQ